MPTGCTAEIQNGISFEDFVMTCARQMGPLIRLKDDFNAPIPEKFEPSKYHLETLKLYEEQLKKLQEMLPFEIEAAAKEHYERRIEYNKTMKQKNILLEEKYKKIKKQVEEWQPPTKKHEALKKFMFEQINASIECDCHNDYFNETPVKLTGRQWLEEKIEDTKDSIEYHKEKYEKEIIFTKETNEWLNQLRDSLKKD